MFDVGLDPESGFRADPDLYHRTVCSVSTRLNINYPHTGEGSRSASDLYKNVTCLELVETNLHP